MSSPLSLRGLELAIGRNPTSTELYAEDGTGTTYTRSKPRQVRPRRWPWPHRPLYFSYQRAAIRRRHTSRVAEIPDTLIKKSTNEKKGAGVRDLTLEQLVKLGEECKRQPKTGKD